LRNRRFFESAQKKKHRVFPQGKNGRRIFGTETDRRLFCLIFQSFSKETTGKVLALLKWFVVFAGLAFLLLEDELNKASAQRFDLPSERFWC